MVIFYDPELDVSFKDVSEFPKEWSATGVFFFIFFSFFDRPRIRYIKAGFLCNRLPKYNPDSKIHNVTEKKTDKKLTKIRKGKRH